MHRFEKIIPNLRSKKWLIKISPIKLFNVMVASDVLLDTKNYLELILVMKLKSARVTRRTFLINGAIFAAAAGSSLPPLHATTKTFDALKKAANFSNRKGRLLSAKRIRELASKISLDHQVPAHINNGEELDYPFIATYTKGLKHNDLGEVDPECWNTFAKAIASGEFDDFEEIPMTQRPLKNPLAGLSFELLGSDPTLFEMKPAPRIDSPENSAEMGELYWESLCRDVHFEDYAKSAIILDAASSLSRFSHFKGPKTNEGIKPSCLFRGNTEGDLIGPYISQFLLLDIPVGVPFLPGQKAAYTLSQRTQTIQPAVNYLTEYSGWLQCNNGMHMHKVPRYSSDWRYIRNGRDLANAVHVDVPWQFAIHAAYILLNAKSPLDQGLPYVKSKMMEAFGTFGYPHLMALIAEASVRAARAVWFQKWWVHRRLRPETFGGRIHNHLRKATKYSMIDQEILDSDVLDRVFKTNQSENAVGEGSFLLSQVYPEGSGLHPAYASGHAAMIGAAVTVLKAWFDESAVIPEPVVPNSYGTSLIPYTGNGNRSLTVGGELNKLASNISIGRTWAGIHWRSDACEGMKLGEEVAIRLLAEQMIAYNEVASFTLTKFDGKRTVISV
jgi:hypothetical protein